MHISDLRNKKVGILGFGVEGRAIASFLNAKEIKFSVLDIDKKKETEAKQAGAVEFFDDLKNASSFEILFRSPGIKLSDENMQQAKDAGARITSQVKFFMENCPAKIIGVTGTKGKGTTSKLIHEMLLKAGKPAYIAGNYGIDALPLLEKLKPEDYVVLELSSFQLQDLDVSPHIAVVLMVVPEHLDYHLDIAEYVQAKAAITEYQSANDFAVINADYENSMQVGKRGKAKKFFVQTLRIEDNGGDPFKIYVAEEKLKIKDGVFAEELHGNIYFVENGDMHLFMSVSEVPLRGFHNIQNVAAASMVAKILDIKETDIIEVIKEYKGLEHRLEFVGEGNGIKFYNDSIGTTPESSLAAVRAFHEPVLAVIGGINKLGDYTQFGKDLAKVKHLKAVSLIGEISAQVKAGLQSENFNGKIFDAATTMDEAVEQLCAESGNGDVILLAPGSASFGMFKDYKDRGEQFKKATQNYIQKHK